ncbi:hypothetical protein D3C83_65880 [compost metagenome]
MFSVAPSGARNCAERGETPFGPVMQAIVTGSVADEDAVENAVTSAGTIPFA